MSAETLLDAGEISPVEMSQVEVPTSNLPAAELFQVEMPAPELQSADPIATDQNSAAEESSADQHAVAPIAADHHPAEQASEQNNDAAMSDCQNTAAPLASEPADTESDAAEVVAEVASPATAEGETNTIAVEQPAAVAEDVVAEDVVAEDAVVEAIEVEATVAEVAVIEEAVADAPVAEIAAVSEVAAPEVTAADETATDETAAQDAAAAKAARRKSGEVTFHDLELCAPLMAALDDSGYTIPTPIQARTIPLLLAGRDVLGQAQTGTGKTAAFALPFLQQIDLNVRHPQVLVLTPTRELAIQVAKAFTQYASHMKGLRIAAVYGGQDYNVQFRQLDRGVHIIVGTPGRVMDHMRRGSLKLDNLKGLVLDEADEMLRMGFAEDVQWVLTQAPAKRQTALFSATIPDMIRRIAQQHLTDPAEVTIAQRTATADTVRQRYVIAAGAQKQHALDRILEAESTDGVIVFVRTKLGSEPLAEFLTGRGHRTAVLHGDVAQKQRERIVESFRGGKLDVLVATDVAARGLDVQRISHVVNFDLPFDSEAYIHRIGRTGRAGRSGEAILFVHPRERRMLKRLEQVTRQRIEMMEVPTNRTINKQRIAKFHARIAESLENSKLEKYASIIEQFQRESETPIEQIAAALALMAGGDRPLLLNDDKARPERSAEAPRSFDSPRSFENASSGSDSPKKFAPRSFESRPSAGNREADERSFEPKPKKDFHRRDDGLEPYRIEVGHNNLVKPNNIVGAIAAEAGLQSGMIGRIEIFDDHSIVDLPTGMPSDIFQILQHVCIFGQPLAISRLTGEAAQAAQSARPRSTGFKSKGSTSKGSTGKGSTGKFSAGKSAKPAGKRAFEKPSAEKPTFEKRPTGKSKKRPGKSERKKLVGKG